MCGKNLFLLLLGLFCLSGLSGLQFSEYIFTANTAPFNLSLPMPGAANWQSLPDSSADILSPYRAILTLQPDTSETRTETQGQPMTLSGELTNLLNLQMIDLLSLETQWTALVEQSRMLSQGNRELMNLLEQARLTIAQLRWNLECALERITDAEEGAIALLDENTEIYNQARLAMANIAMLQRQLAKARRGSIIGYTIGGVSFGVGTPLIIEGIRQDNSTMLWSGVGTIGVSALVWPLGHFVFDWW